MADTTDLLKRLEEIAWMHRDGYMCASSCDTCWLLKLTRALLESQVELFSALEDEHESEFMGLHGCTRERPGRPCSTCELLTRAERVRRGEV